MMDYALLKYLTKNVNLVPDKNKLHQQKRILKKS